MKLKLKNKTVQRICMQMLGLKELKGDFVQLVVM